jgi:hypothetical protein
MMIEMNNEERAKIILQYIEDKTSDGDIQGFWIRKIRNGCGYLVPEHERRVVISGAHYEVVDGKSRQFGTYTKYGWTESSDKIRYTCNYLVKKGLLKKTNDDRGVLYWKGDYSER